MIFRSLSVVLVLGLSLVGQSVWLLDHAERAEGKLKPRGKVWVLSTVFGERELPAAPVECPEAEVKTARAEFERARQELPDPRFLDGRFALAQEALRQGFLGAAREELEAILRIEVDHAKARALVGQLAAGWRMDEREGSARGRDQRGLVDELIDRRAALGVTEALLAREKLRALPADLVFRAALDRLDHASPSVRFLCAQLLSAHREEPTRIKPLLKRALADRTFAVRREATRSLAVTKDPVFVRLFARNLAHEDPAVRRNAAEALAEFGHQDAIEPLIAVLESGGRPVRNHIAVTTQRAYVRDYDVEVAQGAVIADPIVDVVQDGTVLDVSVVAISVVRATAHAALTRLSGVDQGADPKAWRRWAESR